MASKLLLLVAALAVTAGGRHIHTDISALLQSNVRVNVELDQPADPEPDDAVLSSTTTTVAGKEDFFHPDLEALGLETNKVKDYEVLYMAIIVNCSVMCCCWIFFGVMSKRFPIMYQNNARGKDEGGMDTAPFTPYDGFFGWLVTSWSLTPEQVRKSVGVDMMMMIEFTKFAQHLLFLIGTPLILILVPIHLFAGTEPVDKLSMLGIGHMAKGTQWFWVHIIATWYVVIMTNHQIHEVMHTFLAIRVQWLLDLEPPRSTTVLVEGIPEHRQSEREMKEYFEMLFPGCIESVYIVKKTAKLKKICSQLDSNRLYLELANEEWEEAGRDPDFRPVIETGFISRCFGAVDRCVDKIQFYQEKVRELEDKADAERKRILDASDEPMVASTDSLGHNKKRPSQKAQSVNCEAGFVTFTSEREARLMLGMRCTASDEEWISCVPPSTNDVIYEDLQGTVQSMKVSHALGYGCVIAIFFSFLPLICSAGSLSDMDFIANNLHTKQSKQMVMFIEGIMAQFMLTIFTSMLPTVLNVVLKLFFRLRASAWAQQKLQQWLFWFNFIFVVLMTSLEGSLIKSAQDLFKTPFVIFERFADNLPSFTHFYLSYMCIQWVVHSVNLTRYIQLIKFNIFHWWTGSPERAVKMTEPEDQDYYGIGNRSAQWTVVLIIGVFFSTICPLQTAFNFATFLIIRSVYGYLIVFAEIRKPDLGGPFFVTMLWHVQYGSLAYAILMTGVIMDKSNMDKVMVAFTAPSIFYVLYQFYHFHTNYQWESLPFEELCTEEALAGAMEEMVNYRALGEQRPRYRQEELYTRDRPQISKEEMEKQKKKHGHHHHHGHGHGHHSDGHHESGKAGEASEPLSPTSPKPADNEKSAPGSRPPPRAGKTVTRDGKK